MMVDINIRTNHPCNILTEIERRVVYCQHPRHIESSRPSSNRQLPRITDRPLLPSLRRPHQTRLQRPGVSRHGHLQRPRVQSRRRSLDPTLPIRKNPQPRYPLQLSSHAHKLSHHPNRPRRPPPHTSRNHQQETRPPNTRARRLPLVAREPDHSPPPPHKHDQSRRQRHLPLVHVLPLPLQQQHNHLPT